MTLTGENLKKLDIFILSTWSRQITLDWIKTLNVLNQVYFQLVKIELDLISTLKQDRIHLIDCLPNVWMIDGLLVTSENIFYFFLSNW